MGRPSTIWKRKGRGFYTTIRGVKTFLGHDKAKATEEFHRLMLRQRPVAHGQHSVIELVVKFLNAKRKEIKRLTHDCYRIALTIWASDHQHLRPEDLRAYHVTEWLDSHLEWNPSTAHLKSRVVKIWSAWVAQQGYLDADRLRGAQAPSPLKREGSSAEAIDKLERAIKDPDFLNFFHVLYDTGARPGEIATLEASRVIWSDSAAIVSGKTGDRVIGLTPRALEILRAASLQYPTGPLLRTSNGTCWTAQTCQLHFLKWQGMTVKAARKRKGSEGQIVRDYVIAYDLRHALYMKWHEAGIEDVIISKQLGHELRGQTHLKLLVSTYSHVGAAPLASAARLASEPPPSDSTPSKLKRRS